MTPQTVNARQPADPERAELPGGDPRSRRSSIPSASAAANYGAIGASSATRSATASTTRAASSTPRAGCTNWWTPEDFAHFKAASAKLVAQYNAYTPLPDLHVNGQLTLSENIADLAGLSAAYDAIAAAPGSRRRPRPGLTGDQQFFLSFAQSWRSKMREPRCARQS